jgi:tetratricopeptide (TPR) repeat protein
VDAVELIARAAHLVGFALAPELVSPSFQPGTTLDAVVGGVALAGLVGAGAALVRRPGGLPKAAGALAVVAVAASLGGAAYFVAARGPIGAGFALVAAPLWLAIALTAAAVVSARTTRRAAWLAAAGGVLAVFAVVAGGASGYLRGRVPMLREALRRDGEDAGALAALTKPLVDKRRFDDAGAVVAGCLEAHPAACACKVARAQIDLAARLPAALKDAHDAFDACKGPLPRAVWAEALVADGHASTGAMEARRALEDGGPPARLHYVISDALSRQGKNDEALAEAQQAVDLGGGHDAELQLASVAIAANQLDKAKPLLQKLVAADPNDAIATYDLALVCDKRDDFNAARNGYLAALHIDPQLADARYNVALLTYRRGVYAEAEHHAQRFVEAFPGDPRGRQLLVTVASHK